MSNKETYKVGLGYTLVSVGIGYLLHGAYMLGKNDGVILSTHNIGIENLLAYLLPRLSIVFLVGVFFLNGISLVKGTPINMPSINIGFKGRLDNKTVADAKIAILNNEDNNWSEKLKRENEQLTVQIADYSNRDKLKDEKIISLEEEIREEKIQSQKLLRKIAKTKEYYERAANDAQHEVNQAVIEVQSINDYLKAWESALNAESREFEINKIRFKFKNITDQLKNTDAYLTKVNEGI